MQCPQPSVNLVRDLEEGLRKEEEVAASLDISYCSRRDNSLIHGPKAEGKLNLWATGVY